VNGDPPILTIYPMKTNSNSPPLGRAILKAMHRNGRMSQTDLARHMGRPIKTINELIHGKCRLTEETALQLEDQFTVPAERWLALQTKTILLELRHARAAVSR